MKKNLFFKKILIPLALLLKHLGFDIKILVSYIYIFKFIKQRYKWIKQGGNITKISMRLSSYFGSAGNNKGHYFHQDLLVSQFIYQHKPKRHIDIASRVDGFVAHVAAFREIEIIDIRPMLKSKHQNIKYIQSDLMNSQNLGMTDSLSCLHALEHFGLGRYNDPIDIKGHEKAIHNLVNMVSANGLLYLSFPIGQKNEVHFNAHRVFHPNYILENKSILENMNLKRFDYVDDNGEIYFDTNINKVNKEIKYGCGIYTFIKKNS
jgi:hypothetical protein